MKRLDVRFEPVEEHVVDSSKLGYDSKDGHRLFGFDIIMTLIREGAIYRLAEKFSNR